MNGRVQGLVLAFAGMVAHSAPALACVLDAPICDVSEGRFAQEVIRELPGGASFFEERGVDASQDSALYLVECTSRRGVKAEIPGTTGFFNEAADKADEYLRDVATSSKAYSSSEIIAGLAARGIRAKAIKLPAGHCGCELPKMPLVGCGDAP